MTETCPFKLNHSALKEKNNSFEEDINIKNIERKNSINSSSPESSFNNLNSEIKSIIENEADLSYFTIQRQIFFTNNSSRNFSNILYKTNSNLVIDNVNYK